MEPKLNLIFTSLGIWSAESSLEENFQTALFSAQHQAFIFFYLTVKKH